MAAHPVHVTLRASEAIRGLRSPRVFPFVRRALARSSRAGFRVIEFSVQHDHVHFIAEAAVGRTLSGGVRGLAIRVARAVNRTLGRRGRVWGSRYQARALTRPRAVRHNFRKHLHAVHGLDPCSSAVDMCETADRVLAGRARTDRVIAAA